MRQNFRSALLSLIALSLILPMAANSPVRAAGPPIGMNLMWTADWSPDLIFADAVKQARYWVDMTEKNFNIGDANGWPMQDAELGIWLGAPSPMNGTYGLSFTGQATLSMRLGSATITNQVYNAGTNTTTATVTVATSQPTVVLTFTNTKRLATDSPGTGVTNVKMMRPSTEGGSTPLASNVTFTPQYKTLISKFSVLRFMQTTATIGSIAVNWADRTPPAFYSQSTDPEQMPNSPVLAHGMAWEYVIQLCNETSKDVWINVPRFATDDYITKLAQIFKYGSDGVNPYTSTQASPVYPPLNPGLHCYVEYSNENWNYTPSDLTDTGNSEINTYPVTVNGLCTSVVNGPISSVAGAYTSRIGELNGGNGFSAKAGQFPSNSTVLQPNYFRDVVFNNGGNTSVFTAQTPAATANDTGGADELGMKFKTTQAGQITALKFYKPLGETGSHTGNLWALGAPGGVQVCQLMSGHGSQAGTPPSISQSVSFPATGVYTIKYYAATEVHSANTTIQVSVDGVNVGAAIPTGAGFTQYTSAGFTISTIGSHTIQLTNTATISGQNAFIDLVTVQGAGTVTVANNSFETPVVNSQWQNPTSWTFTTGGGYCLVWSDPGVTEFSTKLASANFTGETSSGWQTVNLGAAVNIAANTNYVVSVNSNSIYGVTNTQQKGPLDWDGNTSLGFYRKWVERAVQMSSIFRTVYGDSFMPGTSSNPIVRPMLMMLASGGWIDNFTANDLQFLQDYFNNQAALTATPDGAITTAHPPTYYFYGAGGAPYYSPSSSYDINTVWTSGSWDTPTFINTWLTGTANYYVPQWGHYASYEGGAQLPDDLALSQSIWYDTRMESLETSHQTAYNQYGGDLFVYFCTDQNYQWGFTQDIYNLATPKLIGVDQINASTQAASIYGTGIPSTIAASTTVPAIASLNLSNMAATAIHMDYAGYVVNVANAAVFNIALSAGSAGTTNQADVYVDGVLAGTITLPNTGSNTTYATSTGVSTPSLGVGTHGIMVKAKAGSFGLSALFVTGGVVTIPNPPTGLTATGTYQQVGLAWTPSSGATSYSVYRGTTAGGESTTAIATGIITSSYTNTGLTNGTTYYYKVKAVNSAGTSGYSNEASAAAVDNVAHITNTASAPVIDGTVDAAWSSAPSYTLGHVTTGSTTDTASYQMLWDSTNLYVLATVNDGVLFRDASVWNGDTVEVYIDGDNNKSTSYDSNDFQYAFQYNNATATESKHSPGSLTGVTFAQGNFSGGYRIEIKIPWTTIGVTPSANNLIGTDVMSDDSDAAGVRKGKIAWWATVDNTWSNPSLMGTGVLLNVSAPPAPAGLTATAGNAQVALAWNASTGATTYNVLRSTVNGSGYASVATGIAATSYTNTGLTNGTSYYFVVTATNAQGTSGNSNQASSTPSAGSETSLTRTGWVATASQTSGTNTANKALDGDVATWWDSGSNQVPGIWFQLDMLSAQTFNQVVLSLPAAPWNYYFPCFYALYVSSDGVNWGNAVATGQQSLPAVTTISFANQTARYLKIQLTQNGLFNGNGWIINEINVNTSAAIPPAPPTGLTATGANTQIALAWNAVTGATAYDIKRSTVSGSGYATVSSPTVANYTNTGLTNGITYYFVVDAKNASGTSANSAQASAAPYAVAIANTATAPVIDGTIDAAWSSATAYTLSHNVDGTAVPASDISGTVKAMWDAANLYVLYQVTDDVKMNDSTNPYDDDAVEVFIDGNYSHGSSYDNVDDVQYVFGWGDATFGTYGITGHTAGITFAKADPTGTTYVIEIKIPWSTIGGSASTGRIIGFDGHIDDDDDGGIRDNALAYSDTTNIDWSTPSAFAAARLN